MCEGESRGTAHRTRAEAGVDSLRRAGALIWRVPWPSVNFQLETLSFPPLCLQKSN